MFKYLTKEKNRFLFEELRNDEIRRQKIGYKKRDEKYN